MEKVQTTFQIQNYTLLFYRKENDLKYSFKIENEPEITASLLAMVITKRVSETKISYAAKGIRQILTAKSFKDTTMQTNENPIVELGLTVQTIFGKNIETQVVSKTGPAHAPTIKVEIRTPDGKRFEGTGRNKSIAKQEAAIKALKLYETNK